MPPIAKLPIKDSKVYQQCSTVYKALLKNSVETEINGEKVRQWSGTIMAEFYKCDVPIGSYSKVKSQLETLGCITITTEGRVGMPTVVILHYDPESVEWPEKLSPKPLTRRGGADMLRQQVADILTSLGGLNVKDALIAQQLQINELIEEVALLKKERTVGKTAKAKSSS